MLDRVIAARVFIETVEQGSATAAAEVLGMSRAMVSRYLAAMEDWAGTRLLHRSTRHMSLSLAGESVLERSKALIVVADGIANFSSAGSEPQGWLRIAAPAILAEVCIVPLLASFSDLYPKISVDLQVTDRAVDLIQDRIDIALRITDRLGDAVIARRLGPVHSLLCASPDYLAKAGCPEVPEDLKHHLCVTYGQFGGREWVLSGPDRTVRVQVDGRLQTNEALLLLRAAIDGQGIAMLPGFAIGTALADNKLVTVLPDWHPPPLSVHALYASRRHLPTTTRVFIDFMAQALRIDPRFQALQQ